jgi:hypothetical protein
VIFLVALRHFFRLCKWSYLFKNAAEISRSIEVCSLEGLLIMVDNFWNTIHSGVEDVTIQSKTVWSSLRGLRKGSTETIKIYHFRWVIVLQNIADRVDNLKILVPLRIKVMKRIGGVDCSIGKSEINSQRKFNITSSKDIL